METYIFIIPIVPNFGSYLNSVLETAFPLLVGLILIKPTVKFLPSPKKNRYSRIASFIVPTILLIIVLLNTGLIKYQMFVIGSNSMNTYIYRGDVIIARRANSKEVKNIKKGEILVFRWNNKIISHRVYNVIKKDGKVYFKTKGDNNDQVDNNIAKEKDVIGTWYQDPIDFEAYSTDSNVPLSLGIVANTVGTVRGALAHTREEWIELSSLENGLRIALALMLDYVEI